MSTAIAHASEALEALFWNEIIQTASTERVCPYRGNTHISSEQYVLFCECPKSYEQLAACGAPHELLCSSHMCPVRTFLVGAIH